MTHLTGSGSILGIGIDIIEVERIERGVGRYGERFRRKIFTDDEWAYCFTKARPYEHLAGRFAAKEAVMKALGEGWTEKTSFREIEVVRQKGAAPEIVLSPRMNRILPPASRIWLSISHTEHYAVAQAVISHEPDCGGTVPYSPEKPQTPGDGGSS